MLLSIDSASNLLCSMKQVNINMTIMMMYTTNIGWYSVIPTNCKHTEVELCIFTCRFEPLTGLIKQEDGQVIVGGGKGGNKGLDGFTSEKSHAVSS